MNELKTKKNATGSFKRFPVIAAALLALFLGALDALVMTAAMPTIVSDLGGLSLYSWVYSAYFLSRAVSLPIFGKLADLLKVKFVFMASIGIFLVSSVMAGMSGSMGFLIFSRVLQGIGAGGNFALVYIVLTEVSPPGKRGKTLALASFIWGIASLLGPTLGGLVVSFFSWRWIFFMNVPLGLLSLAGLYFFLVEIREKKKKVYLDFAGVFTLSIAILSLLTAFLIGGRKYAWLSPEILGLLGMTILFGAWFYLVERRAPEPLLSLQFFRLKGFRTGNISVFLSSFVIFSLFAYAPLFIQGVLLKNPMELGISMLSLSLGWSMGSLSLGQVIENVGERKSAVTGGILLITGTGSTLFFSTDTSITFCFITFLIVGFGMGFVTLATLLIVQNSLETENLGMATSSHQFARTLGGTVGIGICGGLFTSRLVTEINRLSINGVSELFKGKDISGHMANLINPQALAKLSGPTREILQTAVNASLSLTFKIVFGGAILCLIFCLFLPTKSRQPD